MPHLPLFLWKRHARSFFVASLPVLPVYAQSFVPSCPVGVPLCASTTWVQTTPGTSTTTPKRTLIDDDYIPARKRPKGEFPTVTTRPPPPAQERDSLPPGRQLVLTTGTQSGIVCDSSGACSPASGRAPSSARLICPAYDVPFAPYSLQIDYYLGGPPDPGFVYTAVVNQQSQQADYLTQSGGWATYSGGLYPPTQYMDSVTPGSYSRTLVLPSPQFQLSPESGEPQRGPFIYTGWTIYVGYGVYTKPAQESVVRRRTGLNSVEKEWKKSGRWNNQYDSDDRMIAISIQQYMIDNNTWSPIYTLPDVGEACFPKPITTVSTQP